MDTETTSLTFILQGRAPFAVCAKSNQAGEPRDGLVAHPTYEANPLPNNWTAVSQIKKMFGSFLQKF